MKNLIVASCVIAAFTGCATITRGTTTPFLMTSVPSGANVRLSNGMTCITPCAIEVKRQPGFTVSVSKEGYKDMSTGVISKLSGNGTVAVAGNIVAGGLIGAWVDGYNGSANDLTPNPLHVTLEKE
jgi:hypothetical protein